MKIKLFFAHSMAIFALTVALAMGASSLMAASVNPLASDHAEVAACGKCGDGACNKRCGETAANCPKDCGVTEQSQRLACGRCGDGVCVKQCGENERSCPRDCAVKVQDDIMAALKGN